jgi:hypothetical protein
MIGCSVGGCPEPAVHAKLCVAHLGRKLRRQAQREARRPRAKPRTERTPEQRRATLVARYGLTPEDYAKRLDDQGGRCAVCNGIEQTGRALAIDHDHATGEVRGLLCGRCNTALGLLGDDPTRLASALEYLTGGALHATENRRETSDATILRISGEARVSGSPRTYDPSGVV